MSERERERERECVCVCVRARARVYVRVRLKFVSVYLFRVLVVWGSLSQKTFYILFNCNDNILLYKTLSCMVQ